MIMSEKTLTCPKCGQGGFLNLKAHHCKAVATIDGKAELVTSNDLKAIAKEINDGWRDTQAMFRKAIERAVYYGSLLIEVKNRLPHGQFGSWIKAECPQIPERTTRQWMVLADEAVKALPQIKDIDIPAHQLLIAAPDTLTEEQRTVQGDFFALLDGKTQKELLWGFRAPRGGDVTPRDASGKRLAAPRRTQAQIEADTLAAEGGVWTVELHRLIVTGLNTGEEGKRLWDTLADPELDQLSTTLNDLLLLVRGSVNRRRQRR